MKYKRVRQNIVKMLHESNMNTLEIYDRLKTLNPKITPTMHQLANILSKNKDVVQVHNHKDLGNENIAYGLDGHAYKVTVWGLRR